MSSDPVQLNGVAHVYLTVADFGACLPFYEKLLPFLDMRCLVRTDTLYYCVGGRTGIGIRAADPSHRETAFDQGRAGLHHLCLRARSREDVDRVHQFVAALGARIVHPPREDAWAPGYYSVLFEDPGGTRLEVNFVPGKGWLDPERRLPLEDPLQARLSEGGDSAASEAEPGAPGGFVEWTEPITGPAAALDLVTACVERGTHRLLVDATLLPPEFFDLRTGVAGELLQKLVNYRIKAAIVFPPDGAYGERFTEFLREAKRGRELRAFTGRAEAEAWLG